jgi:V8-like Glu-specific endopeptidase
MRTLVSVTFFGLLAISDLGYGLNRTRRAAGCGETVELTPGKTKLINSKPGDCSWTFLGTDKCQPEIVCIQVKLNGGCDAESVKISDGIGGEVQLCGNAPFTKPKVASGNGRDIYVDTHIKTGAFSCKAQCSKNPGGADILPPEGAVKNEEFGCVCGLQNKDDRIVGGEDAKKKEFPWQVAIVMPGTRQPMCGGSVINNRYILTAAHCFWFAKIQPKEIEVLVHAYLLDFTVTRDDASEKIKLGDEGSMQGRGHEFAQTTDEKEGTQRFKVVEIINHPLFTPGYDYDIALLKLDRKIDLKSADAPTPICLPPAASYKETYVGLSPTVVGWGLADEVAGATTRLLQKLDVPVIDLDRCRKIMPHELTDRMLCAGFEDGKKDACTGDSGGPLSIKQANKQWVQVGIVSWGEGCARENRPGLYSRVTEFIQWIYHHTNKPGTMWCRQNKN